MISRHAFLQTIAVAFLVVGATAIASATSASFDEGQATSKGTSPASSLRAAHPDPPITRTEGDSSLLSPELTVVPKHSLEANPQDANSMLFIDGAVTVTWGGAGIRIQVQDVSNRRSSGTSGTLALQVWATAIPWAQGPANGYIMGTYTLGTLPAGFEFPNIDSGNITYSPPPNGCFFITLVLLEGAFQVDNRPLQDSLGNPLFSFGGVNCNGCVEDSETACLIGGRFQVRVSYVNASSSGIGTVMSFSGTRAESDESVFLYFTGPTNFEMGLKILQACSLNNHFWVFIGGLTNQGWVVNILDTATGHTATYSNPLNRLTPTTADTAALTCP
jgi:hypothetical protein